MAETSINGTEIPRLNCGWQEAVEPAKEQWFCQAWSGRADEPSRCWLAWDDAYLYAVVRNGFSGRLPRETDCIELYLVHAEVENSLIRFSVNAAGEFVAMASGSIAPQPLWGYWHFKDFPTRATGTAHYHLDGWEARFAVPFCELGITPRAGNTVLPINISRCEHLQSYSYANFGCAKQHPVRRYWPLFGPANIHLPLFYPRLMLGAAEVEIETWPSNEIIEPRPFFAFQGLLLDRSRGALVFKREYYERIARRFQSWGYNRFMFYTEGEFAPARHSRLRFADSYDAEDVASLSKKLAAFGMELVPCHATLGHINRMLEADGYTHLQERCVAQICLSQNGTYELLGDIIDELCAATSAPYFHANTDESLLIGYCDACRELMDQTGGFGGLLLKHLLWLRERCSRHGKRLLIWADMLLRQPSVLQKLPRDVVLANWEYDEEENYPANAYLKGLGFEVLACPWLDHSNIRSFAHHSRYQKIEGFIQTCWTRGDRTLGDTWPAIYHSAMAFGHHEALEPRAIWKSFEGLLGSASNCVLLPWEHLAFALESSGHLSARVQLTYCRYFLSHWERFDEIGENADILYELRRELVLQSFRLRLLLNDRPPTEDEVQDLARQELEFRRPIVHHAWPLEDARITALLPIELAQQTNI